jgi:hypothetical protein
MVKKVICPRCEAKKQHQYAPPFEYASMLNDFAWERTLPPHSIDCPNWRER